MGAADLAATPGETGALTASSVRRTKRTLEPLEVCMRALLVFLSLAILPLASGCLAAAVAAGAVGYIQYEKNEAYRDFEGVEIDRAWKATVDALEAEGFEAPSEAEHRASEGELELDDVWARVERHPGERIRVRVRVGTFDSEENRRKSGLILERVSKALE